MQCFYTKIYFETQTPKTNLFMKQFFKSIPYFWFKEGFSPLYLAFRENPSFPYFFSFLPFNLHSIPSLLS